MPYEEFLRQAAVRAAGHEGHDLLAQRGAARAAGEVVQAERRQDGPGRDHDRRSSSIRSTTAARQPMPAGGLFSTAADLAPLLPDGAQRRRASTASATSPETAVKQMTSKQTARRPQGRATAWAGPPAAARFGHGGAYATNMTIDPKRGLITVFMVQHAGSSQKWRRRRRRHQRDCLPASGRRDVRGQDAVKRSRTGHKARLGPIPEQWYHRVARLSGSSAWTWPLGVNGRETNLEHYPHLSVTPTECANRRHMLGRGPHRQASITTTAAEGDPPATSRPASREGLRGVPTSTTTRSP